jgi:hypothetical protein
MTPRQAKAGIKQGTLVVLPGRPRFPKGWRGKPLSAFQRGRLRKTFPAMVLYFRRKMTVKQVGAKLGVSYQRVEQILRLGLEWFEVTGWITPSPAGSAEPGPGSNHQG